MLKIAIIFLLVTAAAPDAPIPGALLIGEKEFKTEAACKKEATKVANEAGQKLAQALPHQIRLHSAKVACLKPDQVKQLQDQVKEIQKNMKPKGETL